MKHERVAENLRHVPSIPPSLPSMSVQFPSPVGFTSKKPGGTFKLGKIPAA